MKISVIISFYKNYAALELIFKALARQTFKHFEAIVSEDDNNPATSDFISRQKSIHQFKIKHVNQSEDKGFRKNEVLNKSLLIAEGETIVFLDGDCIPHKWFLQAYVNNIQDNILCFGRRVMLDEATTARIYATKNIEGLNFFSLLFTKSAWVKYAIYFPFMKSIRPKGIWGCNFGIMKKHLLEINGFDEDYITAGVGEDVDLEWRLTAMGVKFKSIRHEALQYHLHHALNYTSVAIDTGMKQLQEKQNAKLMFCKNGIEKQI